jgi:hypothetical protein
MRRAESIRSRTIWRGDKVTTELANIVAPASAVVSPDEFTDAIENARTKASILAEIVEEQGLFTVIQGKKHLHVEAWKTIGKGYGLSPQIEWTRPIETGGWEARCIFTDLAGEQVGSGEAECGTYGDGPWVDRASYAQRSMAQTRAISRAGRNCLDWVVVLAGYSATPFEEMPREHGEHPLPSSGPRQNQRQQASAPSAPSADKETGEFCETHQVDWFKTPRMRGFAHPIEGEKTASGGTIWCNYKPAPPPEPEVFDDLSDMGDEHSA